MERKRIYIAGPITGVKDYLKNFERAEKALKKEGYIVFNPAACVDLINQSRETKGQPPLDYRGSINYTLSHLLGCDCIYLLAGWQNSKGALLEREYALTVGIDILYEKQEMAI